MWLAVATAMATTMATTMSAAKEGSTMSAAGETVTAARETMTTAEEAVAASRRRSVAACIAPVGSARVVKARGLPLRATRGLLYVVPALVSRVPLGDPTGRDRWLARRGLIGRRGLRGKRGGITPILLLRLRAVATVLLLRGRILLLRRRVLLRRVLPLRRVLLGRRVVCRESCQP